MLEKVPDAERFMPPDSQEFARMIEAMTQMQREGSVDPEVAERA